MTFPAACHRHIASSNASSAESLEQFILRGGTAFNCNHAPYTVDITGGDMGRHRKEMTKYAVCLSSFWNYLSKTQLPPTFPNFRPYQCTAIQTADGTIAADTKTEQVNYSLWPVASSAETKRA